MYIYFNPTIVSKKTSWHLPIDEAKKKDNNFIVLFWEPSDSHMERIIFGLRKQDFPDDFVQWSVADWRSNLGREHKKGVNSRCMCMDHNTEGVISTPSTITLVLWLSIRLPCHHEHKTSDELSLALNKRCQSVPMRVHSTRVIDKSVWVKGTVYCPHDDIICNDALFFWMHLH